MGELDGLRRLEQSLTYVRWCGALAGAVSLGFRSGFPSERDQAIAWGLVALLSIGSLVVWGLNGRLQSESSQTRLGAAAFAIDVLVVCGLVWIFAYEQPYMTWALLFLIPLEAAVRYRWKGAIGAAVGVVMFLVAQTTHVADLTGRDFDAATFAFVSLVTLMIAALTGAMSENWHRVSVDATAQSEKLAEFDRLKDRFLAVTSHEIRGPVTAIIAGVDTIRRRGDRLTPEQHTRLLDMVAQQGNQLARLVDDLLVTSQLQRGKLALHEDWADLQSIIDHALEGAASKRRDHMLEVFVEPLRCRFDGARVSQVVRNLVENAFKYTPDRTAVRVSAKTEASGIVIRVRDEGEGIPEEKRHQLFEEFSRIEETAAGREGVGLGLYVVSQLTAAMNGRIDLASSSAGTTFSIYLPCDVEPGARPALNVIEGTAGESKGP